MSGITKLYNNDGAIHAISFQINMPGVPALNIRIPADGKAAQTALWLDYAGADVSPDGLTINYWNRRKTKKKSDFREQGERTAWKLMQDWIEVQISMIQLKQADTLQVFLPYVWDGTQTYYDALKTNDFKAMIPEKLP